MAIDLKYRKRQVGTITNRIGCYVLCDLDKVPIYVGQSKQSIRARVNRHLTSARSDIIANRQIDVWEIAWVWTYPVEAKAQITPLERLLYHSFHPCSALMNGTVPPRPADMPAEPPPAWQVVQVMSDNEIEEKRDPGLRLPRQAEHYSQIVGHFLAVKRSPEIGQAIQGHFQRLKRYHGELLNLTDPDASDEPAEDASD